MQGSRERHKGVYTSRQRVENAEKTLINKTHKKLNKHVQENDGTISSIAQMASADINDIVDLFEGQLSVYKGSGFEKDPYYKSSNIIEDKMLKSLQEKGFFDDLKTLYSLSKNESGTTLMKKVINLNNKLNSTYTTGQNMKSFKELVDSVDRFNKIKTNGGYLIDWDIESIGGINKYGHQQLDLITEVAGKAAKINPDGSMDIVEEMNSVLGISQREYERYKKHLEILQNKPAKELTNEDLVTIHRLSMFSDKGIEIEQGNGFEFRIKDTTNAKSKKEIEDSIENALEGLKRYRELGQQQENFLASKKINMSLEDYKIEYINDFRNFVLNGKGKNGVYEGVSTGHNIREYDIPMLNTAVGSKYGQIDPANAILDTYQYTKYSNELMGTGSYYRGLDPAKLLPETKKYGPETQDFLVTAFGVKKGQAHNASVDIDNHMRLLTQSQFGLNLSMDVPEMYEMNKNKINTFDFNGIYYIGHTGKKQYSTNENSFGFVYDPMDNSFKTFDGTRLKLDSSNIEHESYNAVGPKEHVLFAHNAYEIELKDEWKDMFNSINMSKEERDIINQKIGNSNKLYILTSGKVDLKAYKHGEKVIADVSEDNDKVYYQFFTQPEDLEASTGIKIGTAEYYKDIDDFKVEIDEEAIKALDVNFLVSNGKGGVVHGTPSRTAKAVNKINARSNYIYNEDNVMRTIRDGSYTRVQAIRKFEQENGIRISKVISDAVSKGETLTQDKTSQLIGLLGYTYNGQKKITPEYIRKMVSLDRYSERMAPFYQAMEEIFAENNLEDVWDIIPAQNGLKTVSKVAKQNDIYSKKDFIFKQTLDNFVEYISNTTHANYNSSSVPLTEKEANKVDFFKFELFPKLKNKKIHGREGEPSREITSIDLNDKNALIKLFSKGKFDGMEVMPNSNAAYDSLVEAYDTIKSIKGFKKAWGDISKKDLQESRNGNLAVIQSRMMANLKRFVKEKRKDNPSFGYKYARTFSTPDDISSLFYTVYTDKDQIKDIIKHQNLLPNVKNYMNANNAINSKEGINDLVNNYFMTFSVEDLINQTKNLTEQEQKVMFGQYELAMKESQKRAEEILKAVSSTNFELGVTTQKGRSKMFLKQGDNIQELKMHQYTLTDGIIETQIGDNHYAVNFAYNTSGLVKNNIKRSGDLTKIKITNSVENVMDQTKSLPQIVKDSNDKEAFDNLVYYINNYRNRLLREANPRREAINHANMLERSMLVDYNSLVSIFPELRDAGIFENIAKAQGDEVIPYLNQFNKVIDNIADRRFRPSSLEELFANEKNLYFQIFDIGMTDELKDYVNFGSSSIEELFEHISNYTSKHNYPEGKKTLDDYPFIHPAAKFDDFGRPPVYQYGNNVFTRISDIQKKTKNYKRRAREKKAHAMPKKLVESIRIGHSISSPVVEKYLYNTERGQTAGLTLKFLQIDSNSLRNKLLTSETFKNNAAAYGEIGQQAILERAKNLNTYEQQTLMNARVFDAAFYQTNKQTITSRNRLLLENRRTIEMIKNLNGKVSDLYLTINKDGTVTYSNGIKVRFKDSLGLFGDSEEEIRARWDGLYRQRYYKNGEMVTEEELSKFVQDGIKNGKFTLENAGEAINKNFSQGFEVAPQFIPYGQKIFNDTSEKSTLETLAMPIGSTGDKKVTDTLKAIGEEDSIGNVLSSDYENYIFDKIEKKFGSKRRKNFKNAYYKEKYSFSDVLGKENGFEDVSQIGALDSKKHSSISMALTHGMEKLRGADGTYNDKTEELNKIFGEGNWSLLNDGKSVDFSKINKINYKEFSKYTDLKEEDFIRDNDGKVIGHKLFSHAIQVRDDSAGTYAGVDPFDGKGIKYSKLMNSNLKADAYEKSSIELTRQRYAALGLEDEFEKTFSHALNSDGSIKQEYLGKSILSPYTDRMESLFLKTPGQKTLAQVKNNPKYKYLVDEFDNLNDITVDRAELIYSYQQGKNAMNFNLNGYNPKTGESEFNYKKFKFLTRDLEGENKFKIVDLNKADINNPDDWLSLDIGGQADTVTSAVNNPYTNNLMIKYGPKDSDYLAIARMPEKRYQDMEITENHIKELRQLQDELIAINKGEYNSPEELATRRENVNRIVDRIKNKQKQDVTSKTGIANELLEVRMNQSFIGKASGIVLNDNLDTIEQVAKLSTEERAKRYLHLQNINSGIFDKAMFGEKSLLQHYSEGKVVDSVFLSKDAFKKMGYFNEDFMQKVFGNMQKGFDGGRFDEFLQPGAKLEEGMMQLLERHGDSFVAVRYPEIMEGSDKAMLGFLNRNLKPNQILVTGHTGASMKLDHDGDDAAVARLSTKNGNSMINYITSEGQMDDPDLNRQAQALEASMAKRAVTKNYFWDEQVRKRLKKEQGLSTLDFGNGQETMLDVIAKDRVIDGNIISGLIDTSKMSYGDLEKLKSKYQDYVLMDDHEKAVEAVKEAGLSVDEYATAYTYGLYKDQMLANSATKSIGEINVTNQKINNAMASLINTKLEDSSYNKFIAKDIFHIAEEAAISSKTSVEGLEDPNRAKIWNSNILEYLAGDVDQKRAKEIEGTLRDWSEKYTIKDMNPLQYWNEGLTFQKKAAENLGMNLEDLTTEKFKSIVFDESGKLTEKGLGLNKMVINDFIDNLGLLRDTGNANLIMEQLSIGQSITGVKKGMNRIVTTEGYTTSYDELLKGINMLKTVAKDNENIHIFDKMQPKEHFSSSSGEILEAAERSSSKNSIKHAILEGASEMIQGVKKSNLALGAIGLAAGILTAGYVGGRPRPADTQAMEEAQEYQQAPMDGYSLVDPSLAYSNMGTKQGYVVNINARTDKGRKHAIDAIQQAFTSGNTANINLSMNINDNYGNITDKDLERALADVIR